MLMEKEGFGMFFNRDAASLLLLTVGESVLYYFYLRDEKKPEITGEEETSTDARN